MKFRFPLLIMLVLFFGLVGALFFGLGQYSSQDKLLYTQLVKPEIDLKAAQTHPSMQRREGLQKDIYYFKENVRHQLHLKSETAELAFERRAGRLDVYEQMEGVSCLIQEELLFLSPDGSEVKASIEDSQFNKIQRLVLLEAATATYHYQKNVLQADNVTVTRYSVEGHDIKATQSPLAILSQGTAHTMKITLGGENPNFQAEGFKAKLFGDTP